MSGLARTRRSAPGRAIAAAPVSLSATFVRPAAAPCRRPGPTP